MTHNPSDLAAAKMNFTPAEVQVVREQCEAMRVFILQLQTAVADNDGMKVGETWQHVAEHMTYLGAMLSMKNAAAIRLYLAEEGE